MASKLTIAEYEFGTAQLQFGSGEQIAIPGDDRRFLDFCTRDGKVKVVPRGILIYSYQEFERRNRFVVQTPTETASSTFTVDTGQCQFFSIDDIVHKRNSSVWDTLGIVTAVSDDEITVGAMPAGTAPTYLKNDIVEIVGSALDEDRETLTTTKDTIITRQNAMETFVVQRKISDRVNPPMLAAASTAAIQMLLDKIDAMLILGKSQAVLQGEQGKPPGLTGFAEAFAAHSVNDYSTLVGTIASEDDFIQMLKVIYNGFIDTMPDPNELYYGNRAFDTMVAGVDVMNLLQNPTIFPSSPERLTYFRGGGCSCGGNGGHCRCRTAYYDSAWGKLEIIVSPYLLPTEMYFIRSSDVALVMHEKPQLVMLPRTASGIVLMATCTVSLEYRGVSYWWKASI